MKRRFTALTTPVELDVSDDLAIAELAAFITAGYADTGDPPVLAYELRPGTLVAVGRYEEPAPTNDALVGRFELDLYYQVGMRAAPGWLLHAAALERGGRAYVFAGPSGAGKTTLALALLARGWRLLTEEMVLIDRQLGVHGLARPLHVAPSRELPLSWRRTPYPFDQRERVVLTHPPEELRARGRWPLAAIARIDHAAGATPVLAPLRHDRAITRLWDATLRQDDDGILAAAAVASNARVFELSSGSIDAAVALAERLTDENLGYFCA